MNTLQQLQSELEHEYQTTKKFMERYPEDQPDYAPHEKSMILNKLVAHIAEIFAWPEIILKTDTLDFATSGYSPVLVTSHAQLLELLDKNYKQGVAALAKATDADLEPNWSIANNGQVMATWSKYGAIRHGLNQITHHRAQLGVYYRLLGIELPSSYGPTADSSQF